MTASEQSDTTSTQYSGERWTRTPFTHILSFSYNFSREIRKSMSHKFLNFLLSPTFPQNIEWTLCRFAQTRSQFFHFLTFEHMYLKQKRIENEQNQRVTRVTVEKDKKRKKEKTKTKNFLGFNHWSRLRFFSSREEGRGRKPWNLFFFFIVDLALGDYLSFPPRICALIGTAVVDSIEFTNQTE